MVSGKTFRADAYFVFEDIRDKKESEENTPINLVERIQNRLGEDFNTYPNISRLDTAFDPGRIQFMQVDSDGIVQIQFIRLREATPAEIAKDSGELEVLTLDDGVYLAESASALFDPLSLAFVKQRNYFGASTAFIKTYLNRLLYDSQIGNLFDLTPIIEGTINLSSIVGKTIKRYTAKVAYEGEALGITNDMSCFKKYRPAIVDIEVKAKRGKSGQLDKDEVYKQLQILHGDSSTQKLSVTVLDAEDRSRTIDLLTDHLQFDFVVNNINRKHPATHQLIYPALKKGYINYVLNSSAPYFQERKVRINERKQEIENRH